MADASDVSELTDAELYRRYRQFTAELEGLMGYDPDRRRQQCTLRCRLQLHRHRSGTSRRIGSRRDGHLFLQWDDHPDIGDRGERRS